MSSPDKIGRIDSLLEQWIRMRLTVEKRPGCAVLCDNLRKELAREIASPRLSASERDAWSKIRAFIKTNPDFDEHRIVLEDFFDAMD